MKHNDKAWQDDNSARLDALLSDFLDRDIVVPVEPQSFSNATSAPLGDLFPEVGSGKEAASPATATQTPVAAQKVTPVNRTEVWEATNRTGRLPRSQSPALENLAADRLEKNVDSALEASQAASRGKKLLFGSIAVILVLAAGLLIRQSRKTALSQQLPEEPAVNVSPAEIDAPLSTPTTPSATTSTSEAHPGSLEAATSSNNSSHEGHPAVVVSVPESSATASKASTVNGVSQSLASNAAKLQRMPAPTLGRSNLTLGTIQDLRSLQPLEMAAPLPLPPAPTASTVKNVVPDVSRTTTATPAVPISRVQPIYPDLARKMNVTGTVHVAIVVDPTGKVISAQAIDGSPVLRGSAETAVKQWRFKPSTMDGKPVTGRGTVSIMFGPNRR
jgi:TonB family protein